MPHTLTKKNFFRRNYNRIDRSSFKIPLLFSLLNQMLSSGGNFLVGIYLVRVLSLEEFGLYGIGYGICMLYIGVGNALILTQMVVNMPGKAPADKEQYATRMLCAVLLLGALLFVLTTLGAAAAFVIRPDHIRFIAPLCAITIASALFLCTEFFISFAYVQHRESLALTVNAVTMTVLFSGLGLARVAGIQLTASTVLLLYAIGAAIGAGTAYWYSRLPGLHGAGRLLPDFFESWRYGRWALGGVIVTWMQTQTYTYALAFFLGPAGVGQANAAKIFIAPFSFLAPAIYKVVMPRLAELRESNPCKMLRVSMLVTGGLSLLTIIYSALLLGTLDLVFEKVLGRQDPVIRSLVRIWCVVLIFQMIRGGGGILLQIQRKFRSLMLINIPSAVVTVAAAILLIHFLGTSGAIWGMAAGEIVLLTLIWKSIRHDNRN